MKGLTVLLAMMFVLMGAAVAFAGCDSDRWTNPSNPSFNARFLPCGENMYVDLDDAWVISNGNIEIVTTNLINQKDGPCQADTKWEICCDRQQARPLQMTFHYDSDWPTDKDHTEPAGAVWITYNGNMPIGKAANQFCGKKNQLPKLGP